MCYLLEILLEACEGVFTCGQAVRSNSGSKELVLAGGVFLCRYY